jgi:hypothetical protein
MCTSDGHEWRDGRREGAREKRERHTETRSEGKKRERREGSHV